MGTKRVSKKRTFWLTVACSPVFLSISCSQKNDSGSQTIKLKATVTGQPQPGDSVHAPSRPLPLNTSEALTFIDTNCFECHGPGKPLMAAFSIPAREILLKDASWLEGSALNQTAYQVLVNKHLKKNDSPSSMPPDFKSDEEAKKLPRMISWFQDSLPGAVREAEIKYGIKPEFSSNVKVQLSAKCEKLISGWEFQNRFMERAIGRSMNTEDTFERNLLSESEKTSPVSQEVRKKVVESILAKPELLKAFENVAISRLAQKIANVGAIAANGENVSPPLAALPDGTPDAAKVKAIVADLKSEFSQLVKKYYSTLSYPELFLLNKVMVTANTAPLYQSVATNVSALPANVRERYTERCTPPSGSEKWAECTLSEKRGNYFGTRGFLLSKSKAVFQNNNNYGRGGDTHQVIFGEVLMANTDGVSGEKPRPIPECLSVTEDKRWVLKKKGDLASASGEDGKGRAAWGAIAIPFYGRVCQGCHLNRHLAAASVIFRPFGFAGEIIFPQMMSGANGAPDKLYADMNMIQLARPANAQNSDERTHITHTDGEAKQFKFIDPSFYKRLLEELDNNKKATCFPDPSDPTNMDKAKFANSVSEYANYLIHQNDTKDSPVKGVAMVRGLTRFLPSTFLNTNATNIEVVRDVGESFNANNGLLLPMMKAFFQTETFACSTQ